MKLKTTLLAACIATALFLSTLGSIAREGAPPASRDRKVKPLPTLPQLIVAPTDAQAELAADGPRPVAPVRFASVTEVAVTPLTHGTWEDVDGGRIWRFRVMSSGATDLNFGFTTYRLPEGATLHVYSEDEDYVQGPYDARDNKAHGELWTPVLPGSRATIELFVPAGATEQPQLVLSRVNRGYRDMFHRRKDLDPSKSHGACNIDVICSLGDAWREEIRSVARYTVNGTGLCTGTLLNTANNSTTNHYFLTAHHCEVTAGSAASLVVYWNYQRPTCGSGNGSLSQNQSGTFFRATRQDVDMTLVELDEIPNPAFRVTYSGWDRTGTPPPGAIGIHHPSGDVKSISASSNLLSTINNCIGTGGASVNTHWRVQWNLGTTEPGSSGSALFNPLNHRVIGFLSGGGASCSTPTSPDCYGKISVAWDGASAASRLKDWLDPLNSGVTGVSGRDPFSTPQVVSAGSALVSETCTPTNGVADPGELVTFSFSLQNVGGTNTGVVVATLLATNGVTAPGAAQNYGVLTNGGAAVTRQFTFVASNNCGALITPTLQIQDGASNRGNVTFSVRLGVPGGFTQNFDGVTAPALPAGWSNSAAGGSPGWSSVTSDFHTAPNSVLAPDPGALSDCSLHSPIIAITSSNAILSFAHWYETEPDYDGGVLEISMNNSAYTDIIVAGGSFVAGGYNGNIDSSFGNPLVDGRAVWTGNSANFITTTVNLPPSAAGKNIRLRWRLASDTDTQGYGWNVDTVAIADGYACCQGSPLVPPQLVEARHVNNSIVFSFNTTAGRSYVTEFKNVLNTNVNWSPLQTNAGDGTKKSVTNSATATTNRVFRVRAQ